jgi:hypothetical protein
VKSRPWGGLKFKIIGWRTEIVAKEVKGLNNSKFNAASKRG